MSPIEIKIDYETVFLPCYRHLLNDGKQYHSKFFDIDFLYGGRDSGKSRHIAMQLLIDCMISPYFKCLLVRKVLNTVRGSQFSLLKGIIEKWGLKKFFSINESRMEIIFKPTGNGFYCRGLDNVDNIKSFDNPSHCWIEEGNQISKDDFVVILTSLRAEQRVKTWFSFNPECDMNYTEFWLWQEWFSHTTDLSWEWVKEIEVDYQVFKQYPNRCIVKENHYYLQYEVRATQSTYKNNPYCSPERIALYESYKTSKNNAYWYQTYTLGLWGYKRTGGEYWKCFSDEKHLTNKGFEASNTIHLVLDNNRNPYISVQIWQVFENEKFARQIAEIPCRHPDNTAAKAAIQTIRFLQKINYKNVLLIYGDATAQAGSTVDDDGKSFFQKYIQTITSNNFQVRDRVSTSNPSVELSGDFINEIYEANYGGWSIEINVDCRVSIEDYIMAKENMNGGILKKRVTDPTTKISYEKYGHFSDCKRYFLTTVLKQLYDKFLVGKKAVGIKNQLGYFR